MGLSSCFQFEAIMDKTMETVDYKQGVNSPKLYPNIINYSNI